MLKNRSLPILQRVSSLLKISNLLAAEMRSPIVARLKISLKMSRKSKRIKLLKHYNYGYIQEYEYSPSSTPLVRHYYHKRRPKKPQCFGRGLLEPVFMISRCLGALRGEAEDDDGRLVFGSGMEALPANNEGVGDRELWDNGDDNSIDERAEEFIERFYEEMRLQKQESLMKQFDTMVDA